MHLSGIVESRQSQNSEGFCVLIQIQADFEDNRKLPGASITGRHDKKKNPVRLLKAQGQPWNVTWCYQDAFTYIFSLEPQNHHRSRRNLRLREAKRLVPVTRPQCHLHSLN